MSDLKQDMLFIRACKSINSIRRIDKLYRKFYWDNGTGKIECTNLSLIFLDIVEKYYPIKPTKLVKALNPDLANFYVEEDKNYNYYEHVLGVLISHLAVARVDQIKDYIYPIKYRKNIS